MIVSTNIRVMIQKLGAGEYCSTHEGDKKYVQNFRRESWKYEKTLENWT